MALVELGRTICPICDTPIERPEDYVAFPHFIDDENDPLWPYSDSAIHRWCFATWPLRHEVTLRLEQAGNRAAQ